MRSRMQPTSGLLRKTVRGMSYQHARGPSLQAGTEEDLRGSLQRLYNKGRVGSPPLFDYSVIVVLTGQAGVRKGQLWCAWEPDPGSTEHVVILGREPSRQQPSNFGRQCLQGSSHCKVGALSLYSRPQSRNKDVQGGWVGEVIANTNTQRAPTGGAEPP